MLYAISDLPQSLLIKWQHFTVSERDVWTSVVACALFVHFIYNRYEPQPINILPTLFLLVIVPVLPSALFASLLQTRASLSDLLRLVLSTFFAFYATLLSSILLYRISPFHPLANIPGPLMARTSQWWCAATTIGRHRHKYYKRLHDQYGPYVRVGPNEVSCSDTTTIPVILGTRGWQKGPMWTARHTPGRVQSLIGLQDPSEHHERRRTWTRALSTAAVKGYEDIIVNRVSQLVEELGKRAASRTTMDTTRCESVNLTDWLSRFSFDFMGDMVFGGGFNLMAEGDKDGIRNILESGLRTSVTIQHAPYIVPILWKFPKAVGSYYKLKSFSENQVIKRLKKGSTTKDLLHYLTNEDKPDDTPTPFEYLLSDAALAVVAGSDTTSTVLGMIFFSILANPDVYARLREEVDRYFPPENTEISIVESKKLTEMPFLNAVINEAMRLQPPLTVNLQRATFNEWGWTGSRNLPPGTAINIPPYVIHRDPQNFSPLPDTFWPDRWLPAQERKHPSPSSLPAGVEKIDINNVTTRLSAFIPFSFGPANCVGKNLALLELRVVILYLLRKFDMRFDDDYDTRRWEEEGEDYFVFHTGSLPVRLTRRS